MKLQLFLLLAVAMSNITCSVNDLDVGYLYVPEVSVAQSSSSGKITHEILALRVVLGSETIGFYPLPARIPILGTGERTIRLEPAVSLSGLSSQYLVYPMYEAFEVTQEIVREQTDTLRPRFSYLSNVEFGLVEDFNGGSTSFTENLDDFAETVLEVVPDDDRPGNTVGKVTVNGLADIFESATRAVSPLVDPIELWAEIDYKGTASVSLAILPDNVGVAAERGPRYNQGTFPRDDWRKFYFNLRNSLTEREGLDRGPFRFSLLSATDEEGTEREFYIDNVKILYR